MNNVELAIAKNTLTITVDLAKDIGPSGSGKSIMIASSQGGQSIPGLPDGFKINLNVYKSNPKRKEEAKK